MSVKRMVICNTSHEKEGEEKKCQRVYDERHLSLVFSRAILKISRRCLRSALRRHAARAKISRSNKARKRITDDADDTAARFLTKVSTSNAFA